MGLNKIKTLGTKKEKVHFLNEKHAHNSPSVKVEIDGVEDGSGHRDSKMELVHGGNTGGQKTVWPL